jgi:fermentation-respiration switch protein FrsA (DUF1100 family)
MDAQCERTGEARGRMMQTVRFVLIAAIVAYLVIVVAMYLRQRQMQYFPTDRRLTPDVVGLSNVEVARLPTPDGETIIVWYAPAQAGQPTVLYFQGNGGEIGDRAGRFAAFQSQGLGVLFVSYRGYGGSSGTATERGLITDGLTAYDWLRRRGVLANRIMLVGESLGSGVAVQLAAQREVGAVALEAPFASAAAVAAGVYWWLPVRLLMKDKFDSIDHIAKIHAPLLVIYGAMDEIIPLAEGERLFAAASEPKEMMVVAGGSHNAIFGEATWAREIEFFGRVARQK